MTLESIERLRGIGEHLCWRVGGWHQHPEEFVNDLADAIEREIALQAAHVRAGNLDGRERSMSMLSAQCDDLREKARLLRMHADGLSAPMVVPSTKELMALTMLDAAHRMEDAADTIESLRGRLQADVLGIETEGGA